MQNNDISWNYLLFPLSRVIHVNCHPPVFWLLQAESSLVWEGGEGGIKNLEMVLTVDGPKIPLSFIVFVGKCK